MNTPFYAYGVSFLDIVEVSRQGMELVVGRLVEESGHSTVRVMAEDSSMLSDMKRELEAAGCSWEVSHMDNYIAVDIPPHVDYLRLRLALDRLVREGEVEFEESALSSVHRRSDQ